MAHMPPSGQGEPRFASRAVESPSLLGSWAAPACGRALSTHGPQAPPVWLAQGPRLVDTWASGACSLFSRQVQRALGIDKLDELTRATLLPGSKLGDYLGQRAAAAALAAGSTA